jgi:hypothetical protein
MVGPWLDKPYTFRVPRKTFGQMWVRCDVCRRYARLKLAGLLDIDYRKKIQRLTVALNNPEDRAEAAEAIRSLVDKITLRPGTNRGEIDATLHGKLGTILGWMEAQAVGKAQKRDIR